MNWYEMTMIRKVICVVGWVCGISYLVLAFFDLTDLPTIPKPVLYPLFGIYWLCQGINQKSRTAKIMYYSLVPAWFLLGLLYLFFG